MSQDFFKKKSYCDLCPVEQAVKNNKLKVILKNEKPEVRSDLRDFSNIDYLFLTDTMEQEKDLDKLYNLIKSKGIKRFLITSAIGCRTVGYEIPSPFYATYSYCKCFDINKYNPKVVITTGKAFMHFTKSSVFDSWREFREFIFNETYFLPHIKSKWKGRIYPSGFVHDIFQFDTFEYLHFTKQLEFAKKHVENYELEKFVMPEYKLEKVIDFNKFIEDHKDEKEGAFDTETNSLNVFVDDFKMGCLQVSFDGVTGYYIPEKIINKRKLSVWLDNIYQIWANGKFDCKVLNRSKIKGYHVDEDIPLIFHLMNTERDSNSIKVLSWFIGFGGYEDDLDNYKYKYKIKNYLDIPEDILFPYATLDGIVTYRLKEFLVKYLIHKQPETYQLYRDYVLPVIPVFQSMEEEGLLVDKDYVKKYHDELVEKQNKVEQEIYELAGKKFNIASNDELGFMLEKLGLPDHGRVKKGFYQTGEPLLLQWKKEGFKIAEKILEYRKISKMDSTYIGDINNAISDNYNLLFQTEGKIIEQDDEGIYQYIMSDGRVHGNIMPALTDSWRSLSFNPNLQNFPKIEEFRKIFIAPEDYYFFEADYSGFQLRLMAIYSKDENMIDAFVNQSGDLHGVSGYEFFCHDKENISFDYFKAHKKEEPYYTMRYNGKISNLAFAFCYTPFSFQTKIREEWNEEQINDYIKRYNLEIIVDKESKKENKYLTVATDLYNKFFIKYPQLKTYMKDAQDLASKQGYIDCPIFPGLRRHLPELLMKGKNLTKEKKSHYSNLENIAVNAGAQGGEALIVYKSLRKIFDKFRELNLKTKLNFCVHDSEGGYLNKNELEQVYSILKENMEVFDYSVPILAEVECGGVWGFSKEITEKNIEEFINEI